MPVAVDTHVLLPVLRGDARRADVLVSFLDQFTQSVGLVVSGPVYAELAAAPGVQVEVLDRFLAAGAISIDLALGRGIWLSAAAAYRAYAKRRVATGPGWPRRILADFLIGAHAELRADLLLTFNDADFGRMFPHLEVVVPPTGNRL